MANHKSAEKRIRQSVGRTERNRSFRSRMRSALKKLRAAIDEGNAELAKSLLIDTLSTVDATAQNGIIHRNSAARTKSRLTRAVNALG